MKGIKRRLKATFTWQKSIWIFVIIRRVNTSIEKHWFSDMGQKFGLNLQERIKHKIHRLRNEVSSKFERTTECKPYLQLSSIVIKEFSKWRGDTKVMSDVYYETLKVPVI